MIYCCMYIRISFILRWRIYERGRVQLRLFETKTILFDYGFTSGHDFKMKVFFKFFVMLYGDPKLKEWLICY